METIPDLNYLIRLATDAELKEIIKKLKSMGRQTMNFRAMEGSEALVLTDSNRNNEIVG